VTAYGHSAKKQVGNEKGFVVNSLPSLTIASLLKRPTRPVLLLGAGCSVRSGIPTAENLVAQIGKWGYCKAHARDIDDPTVVRTDWWPWLTKQNWFRTDCHLAELYPTAIEAILRPREDRKAFFRVTGPSEEKYTLVKR